MASPLYPESQFRQVESWKKDRHLNQNVLNWTIPENWHITLFFLGSTEESAIPMLEQLIDKSFSEIKAYQTKLRGVGVFPNTNNPKVLWLGLDDLQPLMSAYSELSESLQENGFSFDQKPLKPHLTIARVKKADNPLSFQMLLTEYQEKVFDWVDMNEVVLFESVSTAAGPIYKPLFVKQLIR